MIALESDIGLNEPRLPRTEVSGSDFEFVAPSSEEVEKKRSDNTRSKESSHGCSLELVDSCSTLQVFGHISGSFSVCFQLNAGTIPGVSGNEDVSTDVVTDGQLRGRHIVVTRSLVLLAGGPSMMSLRLSTVEIGAGSCWRGRLMMVTLVFK